MEEKEEQITDISIHIAALSASFKPADIRTATHWFTTDEIYDAIRRIDPGADISKSRFTRPCSTPDISIEYVLVPTV